MPIRPRNRVLPAVLALLALPVAAQQASAPSKKLYCWNQGGQRTCSDALPPEAVNQARDEFNATSGMRSAEVGRALNAEERAAAAADAAQQRADQAALETRKRTDQAMLLSYQTEDELRRVFAERIGIVDNNIQTARYNVESLRQGLIGLLSGAGARELAGQSVPAKTADDVQQRHRALLWQLRMQKNFEQQRLGLDQEIEDVLQRYRAARGNGPAPSATTAGG
ncbi:hypothetical protein [Xanthomonas sp. 3498]|uniref:hypothetical protein n=1 Tax=Xanthomonas sp. 3498 TaxID=2663863 RepID=UPI001620D262|nr:hypothetical protein [Xanthomonas sp. 3498]MBB5878603.1 hypothetical protein [Xanthomonas sp. 3498]